MKSEYQKDAERHLRNCNRSHKECRRMLSQLDKVLASTAKPSVYMMNMTLGELAETADTPLLTT